MCDPAAARRSTTRSGCKHRDRQLLHEVAGGDGRALQATSREALENTARSRELCNVELKLGKTYPAEVQGARRLDRRHRTSREVAERGPRARASTSSHARGEKFDADAYRDAPARSSSASSRRWASRATS